MTNGSPYDALYRWLGQETESAWRSYTPVGLDSNTSIQTGWYRGTRWRRGLSAAELDHLASRWRLRLPSQYRAFLRVLHTTDRGRPRTVFTDIGATGVVEVASFTDWSGTSEDLTTKLEWPVLQILSEVREGRLWLSGWGDAPDHPKHRLTAVHRQVEQGPHLIPVIGDFYVLPGGAADQHLVVHMSGSDIQPVTDQFWRFLVWELGDVLQIGRPLETHPERLLDGFRNVRFWGPLLEYSVWGLGFGLP